MPLGLTRNWWVLALRGGLAILFGVLVFLWPGFAWMVVVSLFAAYALLDGIFAVAAAVTRHGEAGRWWALLLEGLVGIAAGLCTIAWPGITALVLLYVIAFWAIFTGVFELVAAVRLGEYVEGEWALALSGILSVLFGLALIIAPGRGRWRSPG